jgi:hypothetical protein
MAITKEQELEILKRLEKEDHQKGDEISALNDSEDKSLEEIWTKQ